MPEDIEESMPKMVRLAKKMESTTALPADTRASVAVRRTWKVSTTQTLGGLPDAEKS